MTVIENIREHSFFDGVCVVAIMMRWQVDRQVVGESYAKYNNLAGVKTSRSAMQKQECRKRDIVRLTVIKSAAQL
jgi:hypothetical protein